MERLIQEMDKRFLPSRSLMAGLRLSAFITKFFDLKIDAQKGFVKRIA
jgi:hypothetical protein